ncbi:SusD/RagB family nutrient-binding outer membrane lipoprotein [Algoriphagus boritolerans]|uniref:Starch-binding associating with outer membrane n=1 Tax=Algoriphagus boritolerans DSM 17298 = JCM 18970 TaxID=1120964 RepID=A0A1H5UR15_9BACT|nr:SusD/RagB family nutrient-binding outer membrane lipoprotein [Algoriphagus boritolerans]SEF77414.1 Starch-binding associating with outer membrane [Algoriphagus boritolerans DSM 17298 = JCM 18970]
MKRFIYGLTVATTLVFAVSCDEKLEELLENPNAVNAATASPDFLLNRIQLDYQNHWYGIADRGARLTRQINQGSALYEAAYTVVSTNGTWSNAYANILADIAFLEPLAEEANLQRHLGIAKTIKAMVLFDLVDTYNDVPYTEAIDATNFNPKVDSGASIYAAAFALLNEATAHFTATPFAGAPNDYFYNRNYTKWIRMVNTLKLRYFLNTRLVSTSESTAGINALIAEDNMLKAGDDFVFQFGTTAADPDSRHPKFAGQYTSGGGDYQSTDYMWRLTEEKGFDDPRARYYFYRQSLTNTTNPAEQECITQLPPPHYLIGNFPYCNPGTRGYWGRDHLDPDGIPPDGLRRTAYGVYPSAGRFDNNSATPVNNPALGGRGAGIHPIMLAAYVDFMLAEAAVTLGTTGDAKTYLTSGIQKHMNYVRTWSLTTAEGAVISSFNPAEEYSRSVENYLDYVGDEYDDAASADARLDLVAREYWLSLYGNGMESFNLYRRTGKPSRMQPALETDPGPFIRSFLYPNNYMVTNTNAVQKPDLTQQVFWDTNPASPWIY